MNAFFSKEFGNYWFQTERTGKKYPRKAGTPSREPLK